MMKLLLLIFPIILCSCTTPHQGVIYLNDGTTASWECSAQHDLRATAKAIVLRGSERNDVFYPADGIDSVCIKTTPTDSWFYTTFSHPESFTIARHRRLHNER